MKVHSSSSHCLRNIPSSFFLFLVAFMSLPPTTPTYFLSSPLVQLEACWGREGVRSLKVCIHVCMHTHGCHCCRPPTYFLFFELNT